MQAVGVNKDGRTVVMITMAEAREILMQRLAKGREAFASKTDRKKPCVTDVVSSLERGAPG